MSDFFPASISSSVNGDEALQIAAATIGGVLVFSGLVIEKVSDWLDGKFLGEYKAHKCLGEWGWWILMLGIFSEIIVGGWSAIDAWQTRQLAIKNDPRNLPITSVMRIVATNVPDAKFNSEWWK